MSRRAVKQLIYGTGYLIVLAIIIFGFYSIAVKPAPSCFDNKQNGNETGIDCGETCTPCEIKSLSPLQVSWTKYFFSGNSAIIAVEIKNPNLDYGADYFNYKISILDGQGNILKNISNNSFIYAGEIRHVIEILPVTQQEAGLITTVNADFSDMDWKSKNELVKPDIQPRSLTAELQQTPPTISGIAANASAFVLSKATVFAFIYNNFGSIASASKTEIENIPAFGEKNFTVTFPRDLNLDNINPDSYKIFIEAKQ